MEPSWEQGLKDAGSHLRAADGAVTAEVKYAYLSDAMRCLLGVVEALGREVLPREAEIP